LGAVPPDRVFGVREGDALRIARIPCILGRFDLGACGGFVERGQRRFLLAHRPSSSANPSCSETLWGGSSGGPPPQRSRCASSAARRIFACRLLSSRESGEHTSARIKPRSVAASKRLGYQRLHPGNTSS